MDAILFSNYNTFMFGPRKTFGYEFNIITEINERRLLLEILPDLNIHAPIYLDKEKIKLLYDIFVRSELL